MEPDGSDTSFRPVEMSTQAFYQSLDIPSGEYRQEEFVSHPRNVVDLNAGVHVCRIGRALTHLSDSLLGRMRRYHPQH